MSEWQIRPFEPADYEAVHGLWTLSDGVGVGPGDTEEGIARFLSRNDGLSLVATVEERVVAAVLCGHDGRRGYIYHLAVSPEHRRQGLASELVRRCLEGLTGAGIARCNVFVFGENTAGVSFWQMVGRVRDDLVMLSVEL